MKKIAIVLPIILSIILIACTEVDEIPSTETSINLNDLEQNGFTLINNELVSNTNPWFEEKPLGISTEDVQILDQYFLRNTEDVFLFNMQLPKADPDSFEIIESSIKNNFFVSKDNSNVYLYNQIIKGANPETFYLFPYTKYAKDDKSAYYLLGDFDDINFTTHEINDISTFEPIESDYWKYAKDAENVYYEGDLIKNADPMQFVLLSDDWRYPDYAKDSTHVYVGASILQEADLETFEYLADGYAKDINHTYHYMDTLTIFQE